jgi:hypothetical protein
MSTETKSETITVKHAGPIDELEIVLPPEPGLVVLHGDNGTCSTATTAPANPPPSTRSTG